MFQNLINSDPENISLKKKKLNIDLNKVEVDITQLYFDFSNKILQNEKELFHRQSNTLNR